MSDLERQAAARAQQLRQAAEAEAARQAGQRRAAERDAARLRQLASEFHTLARAHGAQVFRRYDAPESINDLTVVRRTDEMCVVGAEWGKGTTGTGPRWAVSADGDVYAWANIRRRSLYRRARQQGMRDDVFLTVNVRDPRFRFLSLMEPHFVAAVAALLDPLPVHPPQPDPHTGVQPDGSVAYWL